MAQYAIKKPTIYIGVQVGYNYCWSAEINHYFWGNPYPSKTYPTMDKIYKSIFDPSPVGYRVAPEDTWVNFTSTKSY